MVEYENILEKIDRRQEKTLDVGSARPPLPFPTSRSRRRGSRRTDVEVVETEERDRVRHVKAEHEGLNEVFRALERADVRRLL
jgi:hypothetical protein